MDALGYIKEFTFGSLSSERKIVKNYLRLRFRILESKQNFVNEGSSYYNTLEIPYNEIPCNETSL